jgi:hypothetical protein
MGERGITGALGAGLSLLVAGVLLLAVAPSWVAFDRLPALGSEPARPPLRVSEPAAGSADADRLARLARARPTAPPELAGRPLRRATLGRSRPTVPARRPRRAPAPSPSAPSVRPAARAPPADGAPRAAPRTPPVLTAVPPVPDVPGFQDLQPVAPTLAAALETAGAGPPAVALDAPVR